MSRTNMIANLAIYLAMTGIFATALSLAISKPHAESSNAAGPPLAIRPLWRQKRELD
jgi:hypothetical protein